jgi:REP element-mobilizing transposase RayT
MGLPRSRYVKDGEEGVYHCFSRCVRRAFLCGFDPLTGRDFSHRKAWLLERMRFLATLFAVDVCAYAIMINHYHLVLRLRPDLVARWSDWEVARRWLTLFPKLRKLRGAMALPLDEEIQALAEQPERIAILRRRLSSLSWFMGRLNEFIARAANKEDEVKGRFWESRFKCQALLDEAAIAACMVYVDLNPIRAGVAATPEESDFTSIKERIEAWRQEMTATVSIAGQADEDNELSSSKQPGPEEQSDQPNSLTTSIRTYWLCPIESDSERRGILGMSEAEYIDLVDRSGRLIRQDKRGAIDADLAPILMRMGARPEAWGDTVSRFGLKFRLAAGLLANLRTFAGRIGCRWLQGTAMVRTAFLS